MQRLFSTGCIDFIIRHIEGGHVAKGEQKQKDKETLLVSSRKKNFKKSKNDGLRDYYHRTLSGFAASLSGRKSQDSEEIDGFFKPSENEILMLCTYIAIAVAHSDGSATSFLTTLKGFGQDAVEKFIKDKRYVHDVGTESRKAYIIKPEIYLSLTRFIAEHDTSGAPKLDNEERLSHLFIDLIKPLRSDKGVERTFISSQNEQKTALTLCVYAASLLRLTTPLTVALSQPSYIAATNKKIIHPSHFPLIGLMTDEKTNNIIMVEKTVKGDILQLFGGHARQKDKEASSSTKTLIGRASYHTSAAIHFRSSNTERAAHEAAKAKEALQGALSHNAEQDKAVAFVRDCLPGLILFYDEADTGLTEGSNEDEKGWASQTDKKALISKINIVDNFRLLFHPDFIKGFSKQRDMAGQSDEDEDADEEEDAVWEDEQDYRPRGLTEHVYYLGMAFYSQLRRKTCHFSSDLVSIYDTLCAIYGGKDANSCARAMRLITVGDPLGKENDKIVIRQSFASILFDFMAQSAAAKKKMNSPDPTPEMASCGSTLRFFENQHTQRGQRPLMNPEVFIFVDTVFGEKKTSTLQRKIREAQNTSGSRFMELTEHVFSLTAVVMLFLIAVGTFRDKLLQERERNHAGDEDGFSLSAAIRRELDSDTPYGIHQLARSMMSLKSASEENAHLLGFIDAFCRANGHQPEAHDMQSCEDMQDCIEKLTTLLPDSTLCMRSIKTSGYPENTTPVELRIYNDRNPVIQDGSQSYALSIECQPIDYALLMTAFASNKRNLLVLMSATQNDDTIPYSLLSGDVYNNYAAFAFQKERHTPQMTDSLQDKRAELAHAFFKTIEDHNACMGTFSVSLPCEATQDSAPEECVSQQGAALSRFIAELLFGQAEEKKPYKTKERAATASLAGCFLSARANALIVSSSLDAIKNIISRLGDMAEETPEARTQTRRPLKDLLDDHKALVFYCPDAKQSAQGRGFILAQNKGKRASRFDFHMSQHDVAEQVADILEHNDVPEERTENTQKLIAHLKGQMQHMNNRCLFVLERGDDHPCLTTLYFRQGADATAEISLEKEYDIMRKKVCKYERAIVVACYAAIGVGFNGQISYTPYDQDDAPAYESDLTSIGFASLPYYNDLFTSDGRDANIQNADKIQSKAQSFYNRAPCDLSAASCVFVNQTLRVIFQAAGRTTRKHVKSADLPDTPGYPVAQEQYGFLHAVCPEYISHKSAPIQIGGSKGRGCVILTPFFSSRNPSKTPPFFLNAVYGEPVTSAALDTLNRLEKQKQVVLQAQQTIPHDTSGLWFGCAGTSTSALIDALRKAGQSYDDLMNALKEDDLEKLERAIKEINDGMNASNKAFQKIFNHGGYDESGHNSKSYMQHYRDCHADVSAGRDTQDEIEQKVRFVEHFARMNIAMRKIGVSRFTGSDNPSYAELSDDKAYLSALMQVCHSFDDRALLLNEVLAEYAAALFRGRVVFPMQVPQPNSLFTAMPSPTGQGLAEREGVTGRMAFIFYLYDEAMRIASAPYRIVFNAFIAQNMEAGEAHAKTLRFLHLKISQAFDPYDRDRVSLKLEREKVATTPAFALEDNFDGEIALRPLHSFLFSDGYRVPQKVVVRNPHHRKGDTPMPRQNYAMEDVCKTSYVRSIQSRTSSTRLGFQKSPVRQEDYIPSDSLLCVEQELDHEEAYGYYGRGMQDEPITAIPFGNLFSTIKGNIGEAIMQETLNPLLPQKEGWSPELVSDLVRGELLPDRVLLSHRHAPWQIRQNALLRSVRNAVYEKADYIFFAATHQQAVKNPTNIFLDVKNMNSLRFFGESSTLARYAEKAYDLHNAAMLYQNTACALDVPLKNKAFRSVYIIGNVVRSNQLSESLQSNQSLATALEEAIVKHALSQGKSKPNISVAIWSFHAPDDTHDSDTSLSNRTLSLSVCSDYKHARDLLERCNVLIRPEEGNRLLQASPFLPINPIPHIAPISRLDA